MDTFTDMFDGLWNSLPAARAKIRVGGRDVIERALCTGIDLTRQDSDQGTYEHGLITVRALAASETDKIKLPIGETIEVNVLRQNVWIKLRIAGRSDKAGIITLRMEAPNE